MARLLNSTQEVTAEPPKRDCVSPLGSQSDSGQSVTFQSLKSIDGEC